MANTLDLLRDGAVGFIDWLDAEFPFSFCESLNEFSFWSTFRVIGERESNIIELIFFGPQPVVLAVSRSRGKKLRW